MAGYAAYKALAAMLQEQVELFHLRFLRNHVIICDLGHRPLLLAQAFRRRGDSVVVIGEDDSGSLRAACRVSGALVLASRACDEEALRKARVDRARYLLAFGDDDRVNAEIAVRPRDLAKPRSTPLTCYVHVFDPKLHALLRAQRGALQADRA